MAGGGEWMEEAQGLKAQESLPGHGEVWQMEVASDLGKSHFINEIETTAWMGRVEEKTEGAEMNFEDKWRNWAIDEHRF